MIFKWLFDRLASLCGLLIIWPIIIAVAILVKVKMPGGPAFFCQKRVGKDGKLFTCHKFRTMTMNHSGSSVSVAGDSRITPFGAKLRHYKIDELPELWDVLIGQMRLGRGCRLLKGGRLPQKEESGCGERTNGESCGRRRDRR